VLTTGGLLLGNGGDSSRPAERASVASIVPGSFPEPPPEPPKPSDELEWPLHGAVTGRFGEPRGGHMHEGIDIPMPAGTPIAAAGSGEVVMREVEDGYGDYTCVAHVRITTCYAHQSRFRTQLGDEVEQGEVIGEVGASGNAPVTHLHFEVRRGTKPWGKSVNPLKYLPKASG
jgi:murein DD-endopeptidase MepM/ murein hydrolase activator NlpD